MWFESLLVFILFKKKKKRPNISGIRVESQINAILLKFLFIKASLIFFQGFHKNVKEHKCF